MWLCIKCKKWRSEMTKKTVNETEGTMVSRVFDAPLALKSNFFNLILMIAVLFFTAFKSNGQQIKPVERGYAPVNGVKVYYEVYGEGKPLVLLHGAFYTIEM